MGKKGIRASIHLQLTQSKRGIQQHWRQMRIKVAFYLRLDIFRCIKITECHTLSVVNYIWSVLVERSDYSWAQSFFLFKTETKQNRKSNSATCYSLVVHAEDIVQVILLCFIFNQQLHLQERTNTRCHPSSRCRNTSAHWHTLYLSPVVLSAPPGRVNYHLCVCVCVRVCVGVKQTWRRFSCSRMGLRKRFGQSLM